MKTNGGPLFPDHLAKVRELGIRTRAVIEKLGSVTTGYRRRYEHENLIIETRPAALAHGAELTLADQHGLFIYQEYRGEPIYVHKGLMNDALEKLRRWQVLDDLAEI